ncbi:MULTISPECIES: potassium channel family protein [Thermococcus]|uniref:Phosphate transport regulator n=2 Tax=Thermococcus sibiricus TaxID=172049 RepID=A0A101ELB6_9EURY|nr:MULTISPECIES: potassium channel family protein [Thermococcus]KUK28978.1 MAG: Phosphate transport regulator [Thermococcus sp. 40_45]HII67295.1 potassium channel family protein [Thermococcaceae archaeon]ACS89222.1 probable phosphate transport regulator [Thermococcus sibiricus MM 739]KUK17472.1 MAG: Phosphate transport regulator [Thermococcus sibiricus]MBC7095710.1 potassium channel family protein [Thermococcus sp.]
MEEFEEFEYQPKSVKEIFIEMKNIVELMVDLAYTSILFGDKEIAEEVLDLEERMDLLNYHLMTHAVLAARNPKEAEQITSVLQMANSIEDISNAAGDLAKMVLEGIALHPVITEAIMESEEVIAKITVTQESILVGKTLGDLKLASNTGVWIIAVRRGKRWIFAPDKDFKIKPGDVLIGRGTQTSVGHLKEIARGIIRVIGDERA